MLCVGTRLAFGLILTGLALVAVFARQLRCGCCYFPNGKW